MFRHSASRNKSVYSCFCLLELLFFLLTFLSIFFAFCLTQLFSPLFAILFYLARCISSSNSSSFPFLGCCWFVILLLVLLLLLLCLLLTRKDRSEESLIDNLSVLLLEVENVFRGDYCGYFAVLGRRFYYKAEFLVGVFAGCFTIVLSQLLLTLFIFIIFLEMPFYLKSDCTPRA